MMDRMSRHRSLPFANVYAALHTEPAPQPAAQDHGWQLRAREPLERPPYLDACDMDEALVTSGQPFAPVVAAPPSPSLPAYWTAPASPVRAQPRVTHDLAVRSPAHSAAVQVRAGSPTATINAALQARKRRLDEAAVMQEYARRDHDAVGFAVIDALLRWRGVETTARIGPHRAVVDHHMDTALARDLAVLAHRGLAFTWFPGGSGRGLPRMRHFWLRLVASTPPAPYLEWSSPDARLGVSGRASLTRLVRVTIGDTRGILAPFAGKAPGTYLGVMGADSRRQIVPWDCIVTLWFAAAADTWNLAHDAAISAGGQLRGADDALAVSIGAGSAEVARLFARTMAGVAAVNSVTFRGVPAAPPAATVETASSTPSAVLPVMASASALDAAAPPIPDTATEPGH